MVRVSGVVWEHKGVGVAVAAVEWDEDAGKSASSLTKLKRLNYFSVASNQISAVDGRTGAPEDAREGHLSAEQPLHRACPHEPQRPARGQLPAWQPWPLRQAAGSLP